MESSPTDITNWTESRSHVPMFLKVLVILLVLLLGFILGRLLDIGGLRQTEEERREVLKVKTEEFNQAFLQVLQAFEQDVRRLKAFYPKTAEEATYKFEESLLKFSQKSIQISQRNSREIQGLYDRHMISGSRRGAISVLGPFTKDDFVELVNGESYEKGKLFSVPHDVRLIDKYFPGDTETAEETSPSMEVREIHSHRDALQPDFEEKNVYILEPAIAEKTMRIILTLGFTSILLTKIPCRSAPASK
ncbi:MAG: hypothetical protein R3C11_19975 [Planctomycetaceae bacterium]